MRWHRLGLLLALTACGGAGSDCPLVGCSSLLSLTLPAGTSQAQACVDDVCASDVNDGVLQVPLSQRASASTADVVVTIGGRTLRGSVPLDRTSANESKDCPQRCLNGAASVDPDAGTIVPAGGGSGTG